MIEDFAVALLQVTIFPHYINQIIVGNPHYINQIIVGNASVNLSHALSKSEEVEHHIKMKIYKLIFLMFWIEGSINLLYVD